jgi:hypothetical protein
MRWFSPAKQRSTEWHQWFAWHPVRIPADIYEDGEWVWCEVVWRKDVGFGRYARCWHYANSDPRPTELQREREYRELVTAYTGAYKVPAQPVKPVGRRRKK